MESICSRGNRAGAVNRRLIGQMMEQRACQYLQQAGLIWIASNVIFRSGEIDIIMRDNLSLVFVEVRYRRDDRYGTAAATVSWKKQQRLQRAAACWLAQRGQSLSSTACRFDIVAITGTNLQWLKNAF